MSISMNSMSTVAMAILIVTSITPAAAKSAEASAFDTALANAYQQLSTLERAQGDARGADAYAARATAAQAGNPTAPDDVQLHQAFLKQHYVTELSDSRQRLINAFEQGGREQAPQAAARAQTTFDCWLEQASEDLQQEHIDACKQAYLLAVADVEKALIPPPPPAVVDGDADQDGVPDSRDDCPDTPLGTTVDSKGCPKIPSLEGVHFEHDKSVLTATARSILNDVASIIEKNSHIRLDIVGHTDATGSDSYNQALSERRAAAALEYLVSTGVASSRLSSSGRGESAPIADNGTQDGRAANRRVELTARPL
jgi:outer membrane protein OmpA-like peptidoglycan-associated protein